MYWFGQILLLKDSWERVHQKLEGISKRLNHAYQACSANAMQMGDLFGENNEYQVCYVRLGNKAKYALEIIECYAFRFPLIGDLPEDLTERVIETEKWYLIGSLSVVEYSMPALLDAKGTDGLRNLARNGPFGEFLKQAVEEQAIAQIDSDYLAFLMRVRNDLIHRNGVCRKTDSMTYNGREFLLNKGEMMEGYWGMLADMGALSAHVVSSIIKHIEGNL